jgi:hypothetical protein
MDSDSQTERVMATATKIKLDVNVPLTGTVKYVDFYAEKENPNQPGKVMAAQWALTGAWMWTNVQGGAEAAEGKVYIDEFQLAASPVALGLVQQNGQWDDGNPKFKWTHVGPIRLVKTEDGRKRHVAIMRLDQTGNFAAPQASIPAAGAVSPPPAASPGRATAEVTRGNSAAVPVSGSSPVKDGEWAALARQYKKCVGIALWAWRVNEHSDPIIEESAIAAAAATLFIESNKRGMTVPAPEPTAKEKAEAIRAAFDEMPAALQHDGDRMPWDDE